MSVAFNPSHLEAVDPVVEGLVRAKQDRTGDTGIFSAVLYQLSYLPAYGASDGILGAGLPVCNRPFAACQLYGPDQ